MDRITGTLKFFGPTKDGSKATLTGQWDNGKDKVWVTWDEAQPLRDAKLVYKHPVETWDDGAAKWMVNGSPEITLEVTGGGRDAKTRVCWNGPKDEDESEGPADSGLTERAAYFDRCLAAAVGIWNAEVSDDVLYKTAFTLYKG